MKFEQVRANDGRIIGKMIYDVDSKYPLGVAQLRSPHPEGGSWLHVRVNKPHEIDLIHRDWVLVEAADADPEGFKIDGSPESKQRRARGEEAGASWKDRPEQTEEGFDPDDPNVFPSTAAAEAAPPPPNYRPPGTVNVHDFATDYKYELTPLGSPLGRGATSGMGDLSYVKLVLRRAANSLRTVVTALSRVGQARDENSGKLTAVHEDLGSLIGMVIAAINDLNEERAAVISATTGHQVSAPAAALGQIDQTRQRHEELLVKLAAAQARIDEARAALFEMTIPIDEGRTLAISAAEGLDLYRISF